MQFFCIFELVYSGKSKAITDSLVFIHSVEMAERCLWLWSKVDE